MQEEEKKIKKKVKEQMVYELGYLVVPNLSEEDVAIFYSDIKNMINSFDGEVFSDEIPKLINLAYPMVKIVTNVRNKFDTAYFGWMKFDMDTQKLLEFKKKLDLEPRLVRFLIIKTIKENYFFSKRFVSRDVINKKLATNKKEGEEVESTPINKEEIDKEIDAMVAV